MGPLKKILLILLLVFNINTLAKDNIIVSNGEWPPFFSKDLKHDGVTSHIVKKAFNNQNIKLEYKWYPWKRALHLAKIAKVDATVGWSKTKDRENDFYFSDAILEGNVVFFHLKDLKFDWNNIESLKNLKIGNVTGYEYSDKIKQIKENKNIKLYHVINEHKLFEMLFNKRFDVVILNLDAGFGILNKYFLTKQALVTYNKKALHTENLRVLFSKKIQSNKELLNSFNKGLEKLKKSGEFEKMYEASRRGLYIK